MRHHGRVSLLSLDRYCTELEARTADLAERLRGADLTRQVVTCPDWTLADLAQHVGRIYRWAAEVVARRGDGPLPFSGIPDLVMPDGDDSRSAWLRASAARLVAAGREADPEQTMWTFLGPRPALFWVRRMASEAAVHGADAAITLGEEFELRPDFAADAISEGLEMLSHPFTRESNPAVAELRGDGETLHFHATDDGLGEAGEWFVRRTPDGLQVERHHAKGDVAVRAPATQLLLVLTRRLPADDPRIQVLGDRSELDNWLEHTRFG